MAYTTIDDPSAYFQTLLYTGNGSSSRALTNDGNSDLQPDWLWVKNRSNAINHGAWDSSRGAVKRILIDLTLAEEDQANVASFDSDGFSIGATGDIINTNTHTYVAWQWKANGGTTTSFSASGAQLAGTRQSNTTAGFSIITYTGDGNNNATIPHGLSSAPKLVIIKERGNSTNWYVGHDATFTTGEIFLNSTNTIAAAFGPFNKTAPDSSNITLGTDGSVNGSSDTYVCYAFAEVQGYSKFGSFTGNGSTDGAFVYTGFQPAFVMAKISSAVSDWIIIDNKRNTYNLSDKRLRPNKSNAEDTAVAFADFVSNGFKLRHSGDFNASGVTTIYMAFAEHPFVSSKGVPTTAR